MRLILVLVAMFAMQQAWAGSGLYMDQETSGDQSCTTIETACTQAGFVKRESATRGIWGNCMKPIIAGQSVPGVSVDPNVVKSCRAYKITELKTQLEELEKIK